MEEIEALSQRAAESAGQRTAAVEEQPELIVATEEVSQESAIAELEQRIRALEAAVNEMRSVRASAAVAGRKTSTSVVAKGTDNAGDLDEALRSLSVEQRIAVKSGLMRAGLM